jgi:hypothetical protein
VGNGTYAVSTIATTLNNYSVGPNSRKGNAARKSASNAHFKKHGDGTFSILRSIDLAVDIPEAEETDEEAPEAGYAKRNIYRDFVEYLAQKPFRLLMPGRKWYPTSGAVIGWKKRLNHYRWPSDAKSPNWGITEKLLSGLTARIDAVLKSPDLLAKRQSDAKEIYDDIRKWGNPRAPEQEANDIFNALVIIANRASAENDLKSLPLDSTWTKAYALTRPNDYVIYDSRVAEAILTIAEDLYRRKRIDNFRNRFPALGHMRNAAASGTRPRGYRYAKWPSGYGSWDAQLQANELCKGIRDVLTKRQIDGRSWSLREVEAVLFMEGY